MEDGCSWLRGCANLPISIELHQDQVCLVDGCVKVLLFQFEHGGVPSVEAYSALSLQRTNMKVHTQ